jgi:hypothetical protein
LVAATWGWHAPAAYALALRSPGWHYVQHACFLGAGLLFWFPVVRPYPFRPSWPLWVLFPYLILADLSNTLLAALLTFSDVVLYPHYATVPPLGGGTALDDQATAGVLMWVPGSLAYLLPLFAVGVKLLFGDGPEPARVRPTANAGRIPLPLLGGSPERKPRFDVLGVPVVGHFLRWRHARLALQLPLLVLAVAVVLDGFRGPPTGPMNLAGVLPWIHWRGLLILVLLVAGNFFCTACPFTLPRTLARRWLPAGRDWPRALRGKWLAVGLLVAFFTAYEAFAVWDRPRLTAAIVVGYFAAAFLVDVGFRGGTFCKYVCPIGQFNFVQSLVSPLQVAVRDPGVCKTCTTKDCVRGRDHIPGCELGLAQPRKRGNMDCTFCLDCVHACPHGNVGLLGGPPGRDLADDPHRSGIGRFGRRPDVAALVLVSVFAAFASAAGMVGPVQEWEGRVQHGLGMNSPTALVVVLFALALVALPVAVVGSAAWASRAWGQLPPSTLGVATRFSFALVPLGFAMWVAHYGYHLATSYDTAWPVAQRFAIDQGWSALGEPVWVAGCCRAVGAWLPKAQIVVLELGLLLTLYAAYRVARDVSSDGRVLRALAPWTGLAVALFAAGVWIILQPMQMRGTMAG